MMSSFLLMQILLLLNQTLSGANCVIERKCKMQHRWSDVRPPFTLWVNNTVPFINPDSACNIPEIREASSSLYNGQWQHLQTGWGTNRIAHGMGEASRDSRVGCFQFGIIHSAIWFTMNECIIIWATYSFWFPYQNTAEPTTHVTATIWYTGLRICL